MKKINSIQKFLCYASFFMIGFSTCKEPPKEIPIQIDEKGRVVKAYNGYFTKHYDTIGRLTEFYGYANFDDWKGCVHNKIYYDDFGNEIRRILYNFETKNNLCKVVDSMDYMEYKYYYINKKPIKQETCKPIKRNGQIIKHELVDTQYLN